MPEDQVQVTEQEDKGIELPSDDQIQEEAEEDFAEGLALALSEDDEPLPTKKEPPKKEEEPGDEVGIEDKKKEEAKEDEPKPLTAEERGKALLDAETKKADEEAAAKTKADEEKRVAAEEKTRIDRETQRKTPPSLIPLSQEDANVYMQLGGLNLFKDKTIKVGDIEIDMGAWAEANPETIIAAGAFVQNFLLQAMHAGIIPTKESLKEELGKEFTGDTTGLKGTVETLENEIFVLRINAAGGPDFPDCVALSADKRWKPWFDKQEPKRQALFRGEPADHAAGWKLFLADMDKEANKGKLGEAKSKKEEIRKKRYQLLGTGVRSSGKGPGATSGDKDSEEKEGFDLAISESD